MPDPFDDVRIRELIKRLDEIQRESEQLRARIADLQARSPEYPERRRSRLTDPVFRSGDFAAPSWTDDED